tara:strand:+ start:227 stop:433 length:207 start_codon:yes stop_codon:yes gene_type:complete
MVDRNWLYELGRLIPDEMMDELEAMGHSEVLAVVQSLPIGLMEKPKPVKKAAPKKKAPAKKKAAKKED